MSCVARFYFEQGKYAEAELLLKRSLQINETAFGRNSGQVGDTLNNLASVYYCQKNYSVAEPLFKRALQIRETTLVPQSSVPTL